MGKTIPRCQGFNDPPKIISSTKILSSLVSGNISPLITQNNFKYFHYLIKQYLLRDLKDFLKIFVGNNQLINNFIKVLVFAMLFFQPKF